MAVYPLLVDWLEVDCGRAIGRSAIGKVSDLHVSSDKGQYICPFRLFVFSALSYSSGITSNIARG